MVSVSWLSGSRAAPGVETGRQAESVVKASGVKGGFCVHLGVTDGTLTAALGANGKFLVHGLAFAPALKNARGHVRSKNLYGRVSLDRVTLSSLPYADSIVNLLVIEDFEKLKTMGLSLSDIARVLAPRAVACFKGQIDKDKLAKAGFSSIRTAIGWTFAQKPWPREMDEWTHWRYNSARTATSKDQMVRPFDHIRWIDGPLRSRGHASRPAGCVSAGGRFFYVYDYGPLFLAVPNRATLVARDAFSGVVLWKKPVASGIKHERLTYPGRAIVARGEFFYAPLKTGGPLVKMEAATGKELKTYTGSSPESVIHLGQQLLILSRNRVHLVDEETGAEKWSVAVGTREKRMLADAKRVYVHDTRAKTLLCLNRADGKEVWKQRNRWFGEHTYVFGPIGKTVVSSGGSQLKGFSAENGSERWSHSYKRSSRGSPKNIFFSGGLVWAHHTLHSLGGRKGEAWRGVDPATGRLKKSIPVSFVDKCAPGKATERYLITGRMDFTDVKTGKTFSPRSVRAACGFGAIPANGMVYTFPTDCQCFPQLKGIMGLGASVQGGTAADESGRLERGPGKTSGTPADPGDWPIYRGDPERRGSTKSDLPASVRERWTVKFDSRISAPTIAAGKVFVSDIKQHQVHALDASDGKRLWSFDTGGRVGQPPSYHKGLVLFGCDDGWVYCLNAGDGKLVWRFRAAPGRRRIIAYGQPASAWPVLGSLLVYNDKLYFGAGRHTKLDKGIVLYCLDPVSGKVHWKSKLKTPHYRDLMVKGEKSIFMGYRVKINPDDGSFPRFSGKEPVLVPARSSPFIDDTYSNRTKWGYRGISGQMLAIDGNRVVGFHSTEGGHKRTPSRPGKGDYKLFVMSIGKKDRVNVPLPLRPRGLLLAGDKIFLAGPEDAWPPKKSMLLCLSANGGKELSRIEMPSPPVFDGLAAARSRLYVSCQDGKLRCFGSKGR